MYYSRYDTELDTSAQLPSRSSEHPPPILSATRRSRLPRLRDSHYHRRGVNPLELPQTRSVYIEPTPPPPPPNHPNPPRTQISTASGSSLGSSRDTPAKLDLRFHGRDEYAFGSPFFPAPGTPGRMPKYNMGHRLVHAGILGERARRPKIKVSFSLSAVHSTCSGMH